MKQAEVTYLFNSGFIVELKEHILIFDYYKERCEQVAPALAKGKTVYMFSSHRHFDHYSKKIFDFKSQVARYFLSFDIASEVDRIKIPTDKCTYLSAYDCYQDEKIKVVSFSSTDEGISFLVEVAGWSIFHAGDYNWWHWKGESSEYNARMKQNFMEQLEKMKGLKMDLAFFPVDLRQEEFCAIGAKEFCRYAEVKNLITMHNTQHAVWQMPDDFLPPDRLISVWTPEQPGDCIKIIR